MKSTLRGIAMTNAVMVIGSAALAQEPQQSVHEQVGFTSLAARLGSALPNGLPLAVGQVEGKKNQYGPSATNPEFIGKELVPMSGPAGTSAHATTVGKAYYGNPSSMSPAVPMVYMWYPTDWIVGYLKSSSISQLPPDAPPEGMKVFNHSWALDGGVNYNNLALRRSDFVMEEHGVLMVAGVVNPPKAFEALMAGTFNGLSVGLANGNHVPGPVPALHDGAGRMKPELVAPSNLTSFATPIVGAAATLLFETAITLPRIASTPEAQRPEVVKAALMAGATHRAGWNNGAVSSGADRGMSILPLDPFYGADMLDVDRAHRIHGAGLHAGASGPQQAPIVPRYGWDRPQVASGSSRFYRLKVPAEAEFLSVIATWNRIVAPSFTTYEVADFDLHLWRIDSRGNLRSMVGDEGLDWFGSGNVVSASSVDNVEHLYVRDLQPGAYMLEVRRMDDGESSAVAVAWYRSTDALGGDIDEDGKIDGADFGKLLIEWGTDGLNGDLNGDSLVDGLDLSTLLLNWFASF